MLIEILMGSSVKRILWELWNAKISTGTPYGGLRLPFTYNYLCCNNHRKTNPSDHCVCLNYSAGRPSFKSLYSYDVFWTSGQRCKKYVYNCKVTYFLTDFWHLWPLDQKSPCRFLKVGLAAELLMETCKGSLFLAP